jgi:hypothetical protein
VPTVSFEGNHVYSQDGATAGEQPRQYARTSKDNVLRTCLKRQQQKHENTVAVLQVLPCCTRRQDDNPLPRPILAGTAAALAQLPLLCPC